MLITDMKHADIGQALVLERLCFTEPWSEGMFASELSNPACRYFAAWENDALIGFAGMLTVLDEGYINNLAVHPHYRRRGTGKTLMHAMIRHAAEQDLSFLTLEVRASNFSAITLYTGLGFQYAGTRRGYYTHPKEDAALMTLYLKKRENML